MIQILLDWFIIFNIFEMQNNTDAKVWLLHLQIRAFPSHTFGRKDLSKVSRQLVLIHSIKF